MKTKSSHKLPEELLVKFSAMLADRMGLHFPEERWGELEKKLIPIMKSFEFTDMMSCLKWMLGQSLNNKQISVLAYHLTIGETYFFRDEKTFKALESRVLPEIFKRHEKDKSIRIWSAGCCTGEEPYSIAMLLHYMRLDINEWNVHLLGTDINNEFLKKAEAAVYKKWSFRAIPREMMKKYFVRVDDDHFQVIPEIQKMVKFSDINLAENSYPDASNGTNNLDLIMCQNVLIYFSQKQIKKTVQQLRSALTQHGWLGVTPIECPFISDPELAPYSFSGASFFSKEKVLKREPSPEKETFIPSRKSITPLPQPAIHDGDVLLSVVLPAFLKLSEPVLDFHFSSEKPLNEKRQPEEKKVKIYDECIALSQQRDYPGAISKLTQFLSKLNSQGLKDNLKEVSLLIRIFANKGDLVNALEWCQKALKVEKLDPFLHYLHAEILVAQGKPDEGINALKKSLFLDPNLISARYLLGLLEQQSKELRHNAHKEFALTLELLENHAPEEILPGTEGLSVERVKDHLMTLLKRK